MATVTVTGYYGEGTSYEVVLDDVGKAPVTGVIAQCQPALLADIERNTGEAGAFHPQGKYVTITTDTIEGVLAYLLIHTDVTSMDGDVPEDVLTESSSLDGVH